MPLQPPEHQHQSTEAWWMFKTVLRSVIDYDVYYDTAQGE